MANNLIDAGKRNYSFATRALSVRDEMLFKSMVRALPETASCTWHYTPELSADVLIVGFESVEAVFDTSQDSLDRFYCIRLGTVAKGVGQIVQSFRIADVLLELNRAGVRLAFRAAKVGLETSTQSAARAEHAAAFDSEDSVSVEPTLGLLSWPKSRTLGTDPRFVRIATVLAAKPCSLTELSTKSGQPHAVCLHFVSILRSNLLIREFRQVANGAMTQSASQGGADRRSFSSSTRGPDTDVPLRIAQAQVIPNAVAASPPRGLWGRIRRSLGLLGGDADRNQLQR